MRSCPNCNGLKIYPVYDKIGVSAYQNVLLDSFQKALDVPRGIMSLCFCDECTLLYNDAFDESLVGYGASYENDQTYSDFFSKHVTEIAEKIIYKNGFNRHKILEIGCGNGYFLKKLILDINENIGVGFDKSLKTTLSGGRINLYNKYYDQDDRGDFDVVLSRHVVEHIIDNKSLLRLLVQKNPHGMFFTETPSLEWIINNNTFFDIFYEHCSYFSEYSLAKLLEMCGLRISSSEKVFGDQYLWIESNFNHKGIKDIERKLTLGKVRDFFLHMQLNENEIKSQIRAAKKKGRVIVWGAGAKGMTLVNNIDPNREYIDCLIDINPKKTGMFCAGSGHEIQNPEWLEKDGFKTVFIMNKNYAEEIMEYSRKNSEFICIE